MASQFDTLGDFYEKMLEWPLRKNVEAPTVLDLIGENLTGLSVLDFGCGTGTYARWIKNRGASNVTGYDISNGMLEYAKRKALEEHVDLSFTSTILDDMKGQFDILLSVYVMPYASTIAELNQMCKTMHDLLRPGGLIITLPIHPAFSRNPL